MNSSRVGWCGPAGELAHHLDVLHEVPGVEVGACCCGPGEAAAGSAPCVSESELLQRGDLDGLVVCAPLAQRAHWCGAAAARGWKVLCASPLSDRIGPMRRLLPGGAAALSVAVASSAYCSQVGQSMRASPAGLGRIVFLELEASLARQDLAAQRDGVLLLAGVDYLALLEEAHGPVDSVWAQSRSLLRNRPAEDVCVAYLKCRDGCEGLVMLSGLGSEGGARLRLHGVDASLTVTSGPDAPRSRAVWLEAYRGFAALLRGEAGPAWSAAEWTGGLRLMQWVQQSARLGREVLRKEVVDEP